MRISFRGNALLSRLKALLTIQRINHTLAETGAQAQYYADVMSGSVLEQVENCVTWTRHLGPKYPCRHDTTRHDTGASAGVGSVSDSLVLSRTRLFTDTKRNERGESKREPGRSFIQSIQSKIENLQSKLHPFDSVED
ncbi:hypothetical protein TEA_015497 [Camellia sinensis var. sinensis]|uniref:Uncharacterized protein n=1 Tax=Camellia sinensis var. sinensis TaxID=542762 RepID=A0A4S4DPM4_CAMSN|nr:hypothetical protein TEA_015497 [Camellia sinensis var. sinensis]